MTAGEDIVHDELRDDLAAFALGALEEEEATAIAEHLAACDGCREYVRWLQPAVELLPASVAQLEPPESLREGLMTAVHADVQAREPATARPVARRHAARGGWRETLMRPATALAALAVLAVGGAIGYGLGGSDGEPQRTTVELDATGSLAEGELAGSVEHGAGRDAILHLERAPALERGHFYQAWINRDGEMEPSASFRPGGSGAYEAALGDDLVGADAVLVTEEAERNAKRPSAALVMRAPLR